MRFGFATAGVLALVVTGALAGCDTLQPGGPAATGYGGGYNGYGPPPAPPPPPPRGPEPSGFNAEAFAWAQGDGPGALAGKVVYRSEAGERWTCATQTIALIPATRYSAERMQALYDATDQAVVPAAEVRARNARSPGVDYGRFVRTAACDAHDAFSFAGLQPGPYFLVARARPRSHAPGPDEGVVVMQRVQVGSGLLKIIVPNG